MALPHGEDSGGEMMVTVDGFRKINPDPALGFTVMLPESVWTAIDAARTDGQNRQDWIMEAINTSLYYEGKP